MKSRLPKWLQKIVKRRLILDKKYCDAHDEFANAYNEFLLTIEEINEQRGTQFTFAQAIREYRGMFANVEITDEEDDD